MRERLITSILFVLVLSGIFYAKYRQVQHPAAVQADNSVPIQYLQGEELRKALATNPSLVRETNPEGIPLLGRVFMYRKPSLEDVKILLTAGADAKAVYPGGGNVLLYAAGRYGSPAIIEELIKAGADPNKRDDNGRSPLFVASMGNQKEIVEALLASGAKLDILTAAAIGKAAEVDRILIENPKAIDDEGLGHFTAIDLAAMRHQAEVLRVIARHDFKVNFFRAAALGDERAVSDMLHTTPGLINQTDEHDYSALTWAVSAGNTAMTKYLLDHGADPKGSISLRIAARNGDMEIAKLLLEHGADPSGGTYRGDPYNAAVQANHPDIAELIKAARK